MSAFTPISNVESTFIALIGSLDSLIGNLERYSLTCSCVKSPIVFIYSSNGRLLIRSISKLLSSFNSAIINSYFQLSSTININSFANIQIFSNKNKFIVIFIRKITN